MPYSHPLAEEGNWWEMAGPRVPHDLGARELSKAAEVLHAHLEAGVLKAAEGHSAAAGEVVMQGFHEAARSVEKPRAAAQARDPGAATHAAPAQDAGGAALDAGGTAPAGPRSTERAEKLVLMGQVRRGAAALDGMAEPDRAYEDAKAQLVDGLDPLPPVEVPMVEAIKGEEKEWRKALLSALKATKPKAAPGPSGVSGDFLKDMITAKPDIIDLLALLVPHLLVAPPPALSRSRITVIVKVKNKRRKTRAVACGEALARLLERACLQRWGSQLKAAAPHSSAHLSDGALRTAVIMQNAIARGALVASVDAKRAFDAVAHAAIDAGLRRAKVPDAFRTFVMHTLADRQYSVAGRLLVPPTGRGTAQGTALGPYLFSLVCDEAARLAHAAAPGSLVIAYLDNLYIRAHTAAELQQAVDAATAQWAQDGMTRGDSFSANVDIKGIPRADDTARLLGIAIHGTAEDRFARARTLAELAKRLSPLAELVVTRDCAATQVVYDQRAGADRDALAALEEQLVEQLRSRARIPVEQAAVVTLPAKQRGLALRPLALTRDAAVFRAGVGALTGKPNILTNAFWDAVAHPVGAFFACFADALRTAGYEVDTRARELRKGDSLVVRAPSTLERAAAALVAERADEGLGLAREGTRAAAPGSGAVAQLLCSHGPKPALSKPEFEAAVRLHTGVAESNAELGLGRTAAGAPACPLCGVEVRGQGHHRWCKALPREPGWQHDKVRDAVAGWAASAGELHVRMEVEMEAGGEQIRADVVVTGPALRADGYKQVIEVKTLDMRCASHDGQTLLEASQDLATVVDEHYQGIAKVIIVDAAGNYAARTALTLGHLQAVGCGDGHVDRPTLAVRVGEACARAESTSYEAWVSAVNQWDAAQRLVPGRSDKRTAAAGGEGPAAGASAGRRLERRRPAPVATKGAGASQDSQDYLADMNSPWRLEVEARVLEDRAAAERGAPRAGLPAGGAPDSGQGRSGRSEQAAASASTIKGFSSSLAHVTFSGRAPHARAAAGTWGVHPRRAGAATCWGQAPAAAWRGGSGGGTRNRQ